MACIAGRIMSVRDMEPSELRRDPGQCGQDQVYIKRDDICPEMTDPFSKRFGKKLLDIAISSVSRICLHHQNRRNIHPRKKFTLLTRESAAPASDRKEKDGGRSMKSPTPKFRYRQRYADLIVNPGVKETFIKRTENDVNAIRDFLNERALLK